MVERRVGMANRTQIARELGLDRSYVSQVLGRKREPGLGVARGLAKQLGVGLEEFDAWLQEKELVN